MTQVPQEDSGLPNKHPEHSSPACPYDSATETAQAIAWHEGFRAGMKASDAIWNAGIDRLEAKFSAETSEASHA